MIYFLEIVYSIIGSLGFAFIFNIKGKKLVISGLGGGVAQFFYTVFLLLNLSEFSQYFFSTIIIALYSEFMARIFKAPATVFLVPSIIPLVPGSIMYYAMEFFVIGEQNEATKMVLSALSIAGSLAMGILIVSSLTKIILYIKKKI